MGAIATIHRLLYVLVVLFNGLLAFLLTSRKLHNARFARIDELTSLSSPLKDVGTSLLLGVNQFNHVLSVRPTKTRSELGNLLIVAPTRGGKGLLAISQLLSWKHSVIINDIKGELFLHTAGYRSLLGPVFVIDPTGIGHRYDPLVGKETEDALLSSATHLLFKPDEGEGAIFTQRAIVNSCPNAHSLRFCSRAAFALCTTNKRVYALEGTRFTCTLAFGQTLVELAY